jgi:uncharacterized protein
LQSERKRIEIFFIYLLLFNAVWIFRELWVDSYIERLNDVTATFVKASIKIAVWVIPVWLYIKYYLHTNPFTYLKLGRQGVLSGVFLSFLLGIYFMLTNQSLHFDLSLHEYINVILLAGITEEIVFRGFILQELERKLCFWKANIIASLLFLVIHYPIWIQNGTFFTIGSHTYVFLLGLVFGFVFKKTGSLWAVVILHSVHNLFASMVS